MYEIETPAQHCLQCGKTIYGRKDKRFCDQACKNAFHNRETELRRRFIRKMDESMKLNYMLLDESLRNGDTSLSLEKLSNFGFRPELATSFKKRYRAIELGCYDIRYNQSDSKIFNIHRIGLEADAAEQQAGVIQP